MDPHTGTPAFRPPPETGGEPAVERPASRSLEAGGGPATVPPAHYPPGYRPEPTERKPLWRRAGGVLLAGGLILLKFGGKLKGLLLLLPKLKLLTTSASMLVSIGAYSLIWGWKFALGFVVLLLIHEMGHVIQLRREGIKTGPVTFIPFLGALVAMKEMPKNALAEARVGLAGPVLGALGCLIPWAIYGATGDELFKALAFVGFFLNLFNLVPVLPLDGGRAVGALSPRIWFVGYALLIPVTILFPNPILLLVLLLGGFETWRRWNARKDPEEQEYHRVPARARLLVAGVYIGLAVLLALGMDATFLERDFDDV